MKRQKSRRNPSTEIKSDWPEDMWSWAPKPTHAHWTSYPTYAYQQFYRANPRPKARKARRNEGEMSEKLPSWVKAPRIVSEVDVPTSSAEARPVPWSYATNAGPFLPEMFPYGQGGRPYVYANPRRNIQRSKKQLEEEVYRDYDDDEDVCEVCGIDLEDGEYNICNMCIEEKEEDEYDDDYLNDDDDNDNSYYNTYSYAWENRGRHGGFTPSERSKLPSWYFLKKRSRGWPAGDPRRGQRDEFHAIEVIRYMDRGFGNRSEYPALITELARRYPIGSRENNKIWSVYQDVYESILRKSPHLPSLAQLRKRK